MLKLLFIRSLKSIVLANTKEELKVGYHPRYEVSRLCVLKQYLMLIKVTVEEKFYVFDRVFFIGFIL
jgi:hypothetical protein